MPWDDRGWNRYVCNVCRSLVKRDAFARGGEWVQFAPGRDEGELEHRACSAKARANLKRLAALAPQAPDRRRAEEMLGELLDGYDRPPG